MLSWFDLPFELKTMILYNYLDEFFRLHQGDTKTLVSKLRVRLLAIPDMSTEIPHLLARIKKEAEDDYDTLHKEWVAGHETFRRIEYTPHPRRFLRLDLIAPEFGRLEQRLMEEHHTWGMRRNRAERRCHRVYSAYEHLGGLSAPDRVGIVRAMQTKFHGHQVERREQLICKEMRLLTLAFIMGPGACRERILGKSSL
jgi:hypothetical protein